MRDIDEVEEGHEDQGSELKIMSLCCQAGGTIDVVILDDLDDDGDEDDVDKLGDIALVHNWYDIDGLGLIVFQQGYLQKDVPDQPVEQVDQDNTHQGEPF